MFFRDIIGQISAKNELRRSFLAGVVPHARLFVGEDGAGALGLAYAYARYINCQAPVEEDACGVCPSCLRYSEYAVQDLLFLFPIINNKNSSNLCDDELDKWRRYLHLGAHTRYREWVEMLGEESKRPLIFAREGDELLRKLSYQIAEAKYRILLIWLPERMHEALGNKLLKLTEEPPERTIILMVAERESEVLGTLRSRMQTLHLRPLSEIEIIEALRGQRNPLEEADPLLSAHLSGGNYRTALDDYLGNTSDVSEITRLFGRVLRATVNARPVEIKALSDELAKQTREEQLSLLSYMARMFREIFIHPLGFAQLNYYGRSEAGIIKYLSGCVTEAVLSSVTAEIDLAVRHISQNVNSRMVFFDLILRLTSALAANYKAHGIR